MQPSHRTFSRAACCAALLSLLAGSGGALAAEKATQVPDPMWYMHPTEIVGSAAGAVGSAVGSVWSGMSRMVWAGDPYDYLPGQISDDDRLFFATLEELGLRLSTINVGGGMLSHSSYRFVAAREPSEVDIERTERKLEEYRDNASGMRSIAKEHIVRSILDVAGDKGFILGAVVIDLWPWPSARYEISDRNRPPEFSERSVIGATQSP